jgi:hypothetical protein
MVFGLEIFVQGYRYFIKDLFMQLKKGELVMDLNWKKKIMVGGMATVLTFGGLAGCGDGVDQDNGVSDGEQQDEVDENNDVNNQEEQTEVDEDTGTTEEEQQDEVDEDTGVNDGVDQDNGLSDGEEKDGIDAENKNPETN